MNTKNLLSGVFFASVFACPSFATEMSETEKANKLNVPIQEKLNDELGNPDRTKVDKITLSDSEKVLNNTSNDYTSSNIVISANPAKTSEKMSDIENSER